MFALALGSVPANSENAWRIRGRRLPMLVLGASTLLTGCSKSESTAPKPVPLSSAVTHASAAPPVRPKPPTPERPYNVVLIMVDSLRADMPWAGYPRPIAPWMTEFVKRSTLYPRGYSLSSYTAKSVAPALVGQYPSEMQRDGYFFTKWYPGNVFISERLQKLGHRTLAGHGHGYFLPNMGLDQGFDDYRLLPGTFLDLTGVHDVTSERLNGLAKEMLGDPKNTQLDKGKAFFAYFHFLDPHYVYLKHPDHPDYGDKRRDLYDNEVHYTDKWVGDLVDWIYRQEFGKRTAVIITADHGEGFGERNHFRHAYQLWESLIRVPLIFHVPGAKPRRIDEPRGHIDLAPTMADLMGLPLKSYRGDSLVPEIFGAPAQAKPVIADLPRCDLMDRRRALIDGRYKLVVFGDDHNFFLFDVVDDPKEEHDLAGEKPELLAKLKARYKKLSGEIKTTDVIGGVALMGCPPSQRH